MITETVAELGRIDVIVNNAGVTRYAYIMDLTEADWDRIHRVNAKGVFFCLQRAAREMITAAQRADHQHRLDQRPRLCRRVERRLCREQGRGDLADQDGGTAARRYNINVNAICPGHLRTERSPRIVTRLPPSAASRSSR